MKRTLLAITCAVMCASGGLALAQEAQQTPPDPQQAPPSSYQTEPQSAPSQSAPSNSSGAATTSADKRTAMKECVAQQKQQQSASGMSKKDIKKYCKNQVDSSSESQPH